MTFEEAAAEIAARWAHGHDELVDRCALCRAEFAEIVNWCQQNKEQA